MKKATRKKETPMVSLYNLVEAYHNNDRNAYNRLLKNSRISEEFKKQLTTEKDTWRKAKNPTVLEDAVKKLQNSIEQLDEEICLQNDLYMTSYEKFEVMKEKLRLAEETIIMHQKQIEELKKQKDMAQNLMNGIEDNLQTIKKYTLVHPTASISSLDKRRKTTIVCTNFDMQNMKFTKFVDYVFHCDEDVLKLESEELDQMREEFSTFEEFLSALEYVKMVVTYWIHEQEYEVLYNSKGIKHMLEKIIS